MGNTVTIQQGDSAESIAYDAGLLTDTVWNDPANADLKKARKSPHVLLPGDSLYVPDIKQKSVSCATGKKHTFKRKEVPSKIQVRFVIEGKPWGGKAYTFTVDDGPPRQGSTDGDGVLKETVSPSADTAVVVFADPLPPDPDDPPPDPDAPPPPPLTYTLQLRYLDPADAVTGVQARLANLGYWPGDIDGDVGPRTLAALAAFQKDNGLDPTGELDDATKAKLQSFADG
ncbi:MAG TPA: peptidoglycan-binding domain-containing protein [Polyangiaceae bacterium]